MAEARQIDATEAIGLVAAGAWLLDVRDPQEWDAIRIPSAHLIPMMLLEQRAQELPEDEPIVVICHIGYRSWQVTKALVAAGYDAVSVEGGMEAWQFAGGVVATDDVSGPRTENPPA